jgi:hypothetical protein
MNIDNKVGGAFGADIGSGVSVLASWLTMTDNNKYHHDNGSNYASAVIVSGHEGDTIFDTGPLSADSLTIWWMHP